MLLITRQLASIGLTALILLNCASNSNLKVPSSLTPDEVVILFNEVYGTGRLDEIGPHTTERFRHERPIAVWVVQVWQELQKLEFEKLDFKIVESDIDTENELATVVAQSAIQTEAGITRQREVFILVLERGTWKIDELFVTQEEIETEEHSL